MKAPLRDPIRRFVIEGRPIPLGDLRALVPVLGGRSDASGWHLSALAIIEAGPNGTRRHRLDAPDAALRAPETRAVEAAPTAARPVVRKDWPAADDPDCPSAIQALSDAERQVLLAAVFGQPSRVASSWRLALRHALWRPGESTVDLGPGQPPFWEAPSSER